ncbi:MAG: hypothetical protein PUD20_02265 [bacterium]|nr:hypothetical protein [bacterium]
MNGKKLIATLGMICACLLVKGVTAQAQIIRNNETVQVDLDGDGTKEKIRFKVTGEEPCKATIYVNDQKIHAEQSKYALWATLTVIDLDSKEKGKELYVKFQAESDGFVSGSCGRYVDGSWEQCFTFDGKNASAGRLDLSEKHPGNGKVNVEIEFYNQYAMQGYATQVYKIDANGALKPTDKTVLNTTKLWRKQKYRTTKAVKVTKNIGDKTTAFTMKKGTRYYVYKVKLKNKKSAGITHIYIKTSDGKTGWVKIPNSSFCEGYLDFGTVGEWNEYAYTWG